MTTETVSTTDKVWMVVRDEFGSMKTGAYMHAVYMAISLVFLSSDFIAHGFIPSVQRTIAIQLLTAILFVVLWVRKR